MASHKYFINSKREKVIKRDQRTNIKNRKQTGRL